MGHKNRKAERLERRRLALEHKKKNQRTAIVLMVVLAAVVSVTIYFVISDTNTENIQKSESIQPPPPQTDTEVKISLSEINTNAKFYTYDADGVTVKYFAIRGSDGDVRVAFDACDVCYNAKKGYTQAGNDMQCINCGNRYSIDGLGTENLGGGCWPSYLPIEVNGDYVHIKISDLENKRNMF
jgi:uncharacterized membrane protein